MLIGYRPAPVGAQSRSMSSPDSPHVEDGASDLACLALVQVVGAAGLRARVPAALARGEVLLDGLALQLAAASGGQIQPSSARGWLYRFERVVDALRFSLRLQLDALALEWPATLLVRPEAAEERSPDGRLLHRGLRPRVAIHVGRVLTRNAITVGPGVSHVARIVAAAHGGQVIASDVAWEQARGELPGAAVVRDLGAHVLVGVDGESRLIQVLPEALDARAFPEAGTQRTRRSNVPPADEVGFGRHGDLAAISELVGLGVRAVSVVGPHGVGKSRLIRHFALARAGDARFPGGVWSCRVEEPSLGALGRAISWAMRIPLDEAFTSAPGSREGPSLGPSVEQLGHALAARGPLLLVLDGLGDPPPEIVAAVDSWLRTAPKLTCVMNVERCLRLRGEVTYEVRPLAIAGKESGRHAEAVRIYTNHARGVDEDFSIEDPAGLAELVGLVGGLPFALRLLAGMVDRLPIDQQLARLRSGEMSAENLIGPILDLLDHDEWRVLVACSALPGSFDVTLLDDLGTESFLLVSRLERRGLLRSQVDFGAPQMQRYLVEQQVRAQVLGRLPEEERLALQERRATALVRACEPLAAVAQQADRTEVVAQIAMEWDGLCEAIAIGLDPVREDPQAVEVALRACLVLEPVLSSRGPLHVGLAHLDAVLRRCDAILGSDPLLQLRVLVLRGTELRRAGRFQAALADVERALSIALRWSDREGAALCHIELGRVLHDSGATEPAEAALQQALQVAAELGGLHQAEAASVLASVLVGKGELAAAETHLLGAVSSLRAQSARHLLAPALSCLATLEGRRSRFDEARAFYLEAIRHLRRLGWVSAESQIRADLGLMELHLDRMDDARTVLFDAVELARWNGDRRAESHALRAFATLALLSDQLDSAREKLFEAMAIDRDRGDRLGEGLDCGLVGLAQHLGDQLEAARESYVRGLQLLEEAHVRRMTAMFTVWLGALEAERQEAASARHLFATAQEHLDREDTQTNGVVYQLMAALEGMEAELAEGSEREGWRKKAVERWKEKGVGLSLEGRLARERVRRRWELG
jgi:tetratricopeptide (TPR) repeat protein